DGPARWNINVERSLAYRLGIEAAIFFLCDRQHTAEQNPGLVEAHGAMRRHVVGIGLGFVALDHDFRQVADARREFGRIEQLRRHRIDIAEIVDVLAEGNPQLVQLAVPGAGADQHLEVQAALAGLAQEQGDVGIIAGVRDNISIRAFELGYKRRKVGRGGRIAFSQDNLKARFLGIGLISRCDPYAIGAVFVNERDLHILGVDAELRLGVLAEEAGERLAILVGVDLRAEDVPEVLVLEDGGRHCRRDPENLLLRLNFGSERHRMRARMDSVDDINFFLVDQAFDLVDRYVGFALRVRVDRHDFVLAADAAALIAEIDRDLRADRTRDRTPGREWPRVIEDDADTDRFSLGLGETPIEA